MFEPHHRGSLRVPNHSIAEISDHMKAQDPIPHSEHLEAQYEHVSGDGFTHPMRKPVMPHSGKRMPKGRMPP